MFGLLFSKYKFVAIAIATAVVLTASSMAGYNVAMNRCKAEKLHELERQAEIIQRLENEVREKEKEALVAKQDRDTNVKEVIKKIPVYVDRDTCSLDAVGVSAINDQLKRH